MKRKTGFLGASGILLFAAVAIFQSFLNQPADQKTTQTLSRNSPTSISSSDSLLTIHFIDVGQADCILIITPEKKAILVDAGNTDDSAMILSYLKKLNISHLQAVIGTHPHEDHIGGLVEVLNEIPFDRIYMPRVYHNTHTFNDLRDFLYTQGMKITTAKAGLDISDLISNAELKLVFLAPNSSEYEDLNNYSAVLKISYGETTIILAGDAEYLSEQEMLDGSISLDCDLLKVGHHGSSSSTSEAFLSATTPTVAVISVENGNDYGHPHQPTLDKLNAIGATIYRTDKNGSIIAESDGKTIKISTER